MLSFQKVELSCFKPDCAYTHGATAHVDHTDLKRNVTSDVDQIIPAAPVFPTSSLLSW